MKRFSLVLAAGLAALGLALSDFWRAPEPAPPPAAAAAQIRSIAVGDILSQDELHLITHAGRYGLGLDLGESRYAVSNGMLIRVDPGSRKVLSILRPLAAPLD